MSRKYGLVSPPFDLEVQFSDVLDARCLANSFAEITEVDAFKSSNGLDYAYVGMQVVVINDETPELNAVYYLRALDYTDADNWERISTSVKSYVDYETEIKNKPTINGVELTEDVSIEDLGFVYLSTKVVDELPELDDALINTMYLILTQDPTAKTVEYDEFLIGFDDEGNRYWEQIGGTTMDLSGIYTAEEATLLATFTQSPGADTFTTFGQIVSGSEDLSGITIQELIEKLFFAVVEPEIVQPTYTPSVTYKFYDKDDEVTYFMAKAGYIVAVDHVTDQGSITLDNTLVGDYAGEAAFAISGDIVGQVDTDASQALMGSETTGTQDLLLTATFADGSTTPLKSDGSEATAGAYVSDSIIVTIPLDFVGAIHLNGDETADGTTPIDLDEGYFEVTLAADPDYYITWDAAYYGDLTGIKIYNGYTGEWGWAHGSAAASLAPFGIEIDYDTLTGKVNASDVFGEITIRCYYGGTDIYSYSYDESTGITTVSITALGKAMINASTEVYVLPELDVEGDISLEYFLDGITAEVDLSNIFEPAEGSEA